MTSSFTTRCGFVYRQLIGTKRCPTSQIIFPFRQHPRYHQHQRRHVALFSQTAYQDPALAWAQSNPASAQKILDPPPTDSVVYSSWGENKMQSLEAYLEWRRWTFPNEMFDQTQGVVFRDQRNNANSLISHLLSAPLTLASQFKHLTESCGKLPLKKNDTKESIELDWCCVGARAEASIPAVYWREFLTPSMASISSEKNPSDAGISLPEGKYLEITLDFVGPDIPPKLSKQSVCIPDNQGGSTAPSVSLSLCSYYRGFFHDMPAIQSSNQQSQYWNSYIFFNPGFGHPNLRQSWESTLRILLNQGQSSAPEKSRVLLLTAHSEKDALRDAAILRDVYGLNNVEYNENPFASRVTYEDPFEKQHFVRPNHYVATVIL
mmetsp:Transcript_10007/g.21534  ORF Transcript_10007/g.21534 Transcript_10007/m.21534 type:complete len:377 (-) Transcript_10007:1238-2368(-)